MLCPLRNVATLVMLLANATLAADWSFGITYASHEWSESRHQWRFGVVSILAPPLWIGPAVSVWAGDWLNTPLPCSLQAADGTWSAAQARPGFNNWLPVGVRFVPAAVVRNDGLAPACLSADLQYCGWTEARLNCQTDGLNHFSTARGQMLSASVSLSASLVSLRAGYEHFLVPGVRALLDDSTGFCQFVSPQRSFGRVFLGVALQLDMLFVDLSDSGNRTARLLVPPLLR